MCVTTFGIVVHDYEESKMDKAYKTWDNNEEDNLVDGALVLVQFGDALNL